MRRKYRLLGIIILLFYTTGCAGYVPGSLPDKSADLDKTSDPTFGRTIEPNSEVAITLNSGEVIFGVVVEATSERVVLGKSTNYGFENSTYLQNDIDRIEIKSDAVLAKGILVTFAVLTGVLIALGFYSVANGGVGR